MQLRAPSRARSSGDAGFSLVEAVVALAIATVVFTALAFALIGGVKSALLSQQNQQAGDVLNKAVEDARALPYQSLSMRAADLDVGDPRSPALSLVKAYDPLTNRTGGTGTEPLVPLDANGALFPHVTAVNENGGTYTVRRYVTIPADAAGAVYKRLTVVVEWTTLGKLRTRTYSTLIAESKRGLPLPDFKFTNGATLSQCRNPGSVAVYDFRITNNGARDAWNLTTNPVSPSWSYFEDTNANGSFDNGTDAALPNNAGVASTGLLEPTTARRFFAVLQLETAAVKPAPYALSTVFRATSAAQPSYFQELTATTSVQNDACGAVAPTASPTPSPSASTAPPLAPEQPLGSCTSLTGPATTSAPGGTLVRYYPGNPNQPGNTAASADMPVSRDAGSPPASGNLYNLSTDLHSVAGRYLAGGTSASLADAATWVYGMPATSVIKGDGEATVWAQPSDGSTTARPIFRLTLEHLSSSGTLLNTIGAVEYVTPTSGWGCTGMRPFSVKFVDATGSGLTVAANEKLRLRVRVTNGVPVRLAYGTAAYPMTITLPFKSGLG